MGLFNRRKKTEKKDNIVVDLRGKKVRLDLPARLPGPQYETDSKGNKIAVVDHLYTGKKIKIDLRKKEALLQRKGIPFIIDDRRAAPILQLLKELYQYRYSLGAAPQALKEEIIRRIDTSYDLIDLEFIGGEGAIFAVQDLGRKKLAIKIALPFEQAAGRRTIEEIEESEKDAKKKQLILKDINAFKQRFAEGAALQDEIAEQLINEGVTWFGVPAAKLSNDPILHIIMPWVNGPNLLKRDNRELKYTLEKYVQILDAVAYLHEFGIVHRDIKAENIIIARRGKTECVYLVDWTLAKRVGDRDLTVPGIAIGTTGNASPKQMALFDAVNATAVDDIWSLGLLIYEIIFCQRLPKMLRKKDFFNLVKIEAYIKQLTGLIPRALRPVFVKATKINEMERYQSVSEMKSAVLEAIGKINFSTTREFIDVNQATIEHLFENEETQVEVSQKQEQELVFRCCGKFPCSRFGLCLKRLEAIEAFRKAGIL